MNRLSLRRILLLGVAFLIIPLVSFSQTSGGSSEGGGTATESKAPNTRAARKKAKKEWKKQRKAQMTDAQAKKEYHKTYNTKKTRKRMKKNEKRAQKNNSHKRDFFLVRWFKRH